MTFRPSRLRLLWPAALPLLLSTCGAFDVGPDPDEQQEGRFVEWHQVAWGRGTTAVGLLRPQEEPTGPAPVLFALSWGAGTFNLVLSFLESYWAEEPGLRGYYVVAPEITASTLAETADELLPAIFSWMDGTISYDPERVALVGASNGGRGIFFAALSQPERFSAMVGLPGMYQGDPGDLAALTEIPIWLLVGEFDDGWVQGSQDTHDALVELGGDVTLEVLSSQEHVLILDPSRLMDWIDEALAR